MKKTKNDLRQDLSIEGIEDSDLVLDSQECLPCNDHGLEVDSNEIDELILSYFSDDQIILVGCYVVLCKYNNYKKSKIDLLKLYGRNGLSKIGKKYILMSESKNISNEVEGLCKAVKGVIILSLLGEI